MKKQNKLKVKYLAPLSFDHFKDPFHVWLFLKGYGLMKPMTKKEILSKDKLRNE